MKNKRLIRNYHLTDADLVLKTKEIVAFMQRDTDYFAQYGITETHRLQLTQQIDAFAHWETDTEARNWQIEITWAKTAKAESLLEALRNVMLIVNRKYIKASARYKAFGTHNLSLQKDAELYLTSKLVVKRASQELAALSAFGLTTTILTDITTLNEAYSELLISQKIAQACRVINNSGRIALGNAIYTELMRYSTLGLAIWETKSTARYNDYLIYNETRNTKSA